MVFSFFSPLPRLRHAQFCHFCRASFGALADKLSSLPKPVNAAEMLAAAQQGARDLTHVNRRAFCLT
jgi:hypothetical protein